MFLLRPATATIFNHVGTRYSILSHAHSRVNIIDNLKLLFHVICSLSSLRKNRRTAMQRTAAGSHDGH